MYVKGVRKVIPEGLFLYLKIPFHYCCWEGVCHDISGSCSNANDIWEAGGSYYSLKPQAKNESISSLIGRKEVERWWRWDKGRVAGKKAFGFGRRVLWPQDSVICREGRSQGKSEPNPLTRGAGWAQNRPPLLCGSKTVNAWRNLIHNLWKACRFLQRPVYQSESLYPRSAE